MNLNTKALDPLLDETQCPVARTRLLSSGVNQNTRLFKPTPVVGDKGCLACGNCVDACPVVREKKGFVFLQNQRTSMALEHMVGEECRRCFSCIKACPQVTKGVKEYAGAFRRGEKIVHFLTAAIIVLLAATGIMLSHYSFILPALEIRVLSWIHRLFALFLLFMPVLYFVLDRRHMIRTFKKAFTWRPTDRDWVDTLIRHIKDNQRFSLPLKVQFNPIQKGWYIYVACIVFPVLGVTGIIQWLGLDYGSISRPWLSFVMLIHMLFALITDILVFVHVYIKYLRNWGILCFDLFRVFKAKRHLIFPLLYDETVMNKKELIKKTED